jgi:hypothetical protein
MFRTVPLPIIWSSLTVQLALVYVMWFEVSLRSGLGWNSLEFHSSPAHKLTSNRMTYTSAKRTVNELLMIGRGTP